jgi:hypothetical protein
VLFFIDTTENFIEIELIKYLVACPGKDVLLRRVKGAFFYSNLMKSNSSSSFLFDFAEVLPNIITI